MRTLFVPLTVVCLALLAACGGDSSGSPTPTGTGGEPTSDGNGGTGEPATALVVIGGPAEVNGVLADAVTLDKVDLYLLTSLSQDPAAIDGVTFAGADTVWGIEMQEALAGDFDTAYADAYGEPPAGVPVRHAYDAVYTAALAAVAANASDGASIKDNLLYVANSPGDIAVYGSEGFTAAVEALAAEGGDVNYIGASGQVDVTASGGMSKAHVQTWKVLNGQIAPIEPRDVDLAAEAGSEVPVGELKRATEAPTEALVIGLIVSNDDAGTAIGNAAELAVEEINAGGGVFGLDVALASVTIDGAGEAAAAVDALLGQGAGAIVGPAAADAVGAALDAAKAASIPLLALSNAPELALLDGEGFLVQMVPSLAIQMPVLANLALESESDGFCVLYAQGATGEAMAQAFEEAVAFKEARVRASEAFDPASGDYMGLLESCLG